MHSSPLHEPQPLSIITADARLKEEKGVTLVIWGPSGIGKTSLLKTVTSPTLCLDLEAGLLAVQDWQGDSLPLRTWAQARDIACLIGGPNPAATDHQPYSSRHYMQVCKTYPTFDHLNTYSCLFIDSLTVASRLCLQWCKNQPEALSECTGKVDLRSSYGLLARELMSWLNQFQHIPDKDIVMVGILEKRFDEFQRPFWMPQIEGSKVALELPGIVDEVISLVEAPASSDKTNYPRAFVCQTINPWGYPAKDRSGRLNVLEEPHLGKLLAKIKAPRTPSPSTQPSTF